MISTKYPRNLNKIVFPSVISACKYAQETSNVVTYLYSYVSIINVVNSVLSEIVGDTIIFSLLKCFFWLLPFSHVLPIMFPSLLLFIISTASGTFYLSEPYNTSRLIATMTFFHGMAPSCACFKSFTIAATDISLNILKSLDSCIFVSITFTFDFVYVCVSFSPSC